MTGLITELALTPRLTFSSTLDPSSRDLLTKEALTGKPSHLHRGLDQNEFSPGWSSAAEHWAASRGILESPMLVSSYLVMFELEPT